MHSKLRNGTLVLLAAGLVGACGTTVPLQSQTASLGSAGLSSPAPGGQSAPVARTQAGPQTTTPDVAVGPAQAATTTGRATTTTGATAAPGVAPTQVTSNLPKVTTPISIGFMAAASPSGALSAIGASGGTSETPQEAFAYFVKKLNSQGGLAGRQISVVQQFIDPLSSNYDTQAAAACATFTQDHHVAAVFAVEGTFYSESFSSCIAKANIPEVLVLTEGTDKATLAKFPSIISPTAPTVERRFVALVKGLTANGYLSKANKIGVVLEDCPYNQRAYTSAIEPALRARGLSVNLRTVSCVHGFGDAAAYISAIQGQVLPMAAAKVDRVLFVSGFEGLAASYFEQQAKSQGYKPSYAFTSTAETGNNAMSFSADAMKRVQGVGWSPVLDVTQLLPGSTATQRCRTLWKGYAPAAARNNRANNEETCESFFFLEAALQKTRGSSATANLVAAFQGLGTSYVSPWSLGGATTYGVGRKDGPTLFATFGFKASCTCFAYTSAPAPLA